MNRFKHIYLSLLLVVAMLVSALMPAFAATSGMAMDRDFAARIMWGGQQAGQVPNIVPADIVLVKADTGMLPCHGVAVQKVKSRFSAIASVTVIKKATSVSVKAADHDCLQCCLGVPKSLLIGVHNLASFQQEFYAKQIKALLAFAFLDLVNLSAHLLHGDTSPPVYIIAAHGFDYSLIIERTQRFRL